MKSNHHCFDINNYHNYIFKNLLISPNHKQEQTVSGIGVLLFSFHNKQSIIKYFNHRKTDILSCGKKLSGTHPNINSPHTPFTNTTTLSARCDHNTRLQDVSRNNASTFLKRN